MKEKFSLFYFILVIVINITSCKISQKSKIADEAVHIGNPLEAWVFSGIFNDDKKNITGYSYIITHTGDKSSNIESFSAILTLTDHNTKKIVSETCYTTLNSDSITEFPPLKFIFSNEFNRWAVTGKHGNNKLSAVMTNFPGSKIRLKTSDYSGNIRIPDSLSDSYEGAKTFIYPLIKTKGKIKINGNSYKIKGNSNYWRIWDASGYINNNKRTGQIIVNTDTSGGGLLITLKLSKDGTINSCYGYKINSLTKNVTVLENLSVKCDEFWKSEISGKRYPLSLQINDPGNDIVITINAEFREQEMTLLRSAMWIGHVKFFMNEKEVEKSGYALMLLN